MNLEKIKVLIIDDDAAAIQQSKVAISSFVLKENIICSASAIEALKIMETQKVDLAFLDVEMPDTNGFSIADYIRSSKLQIKYVFLTGHVELGAKSYDYEPLDFLSKPIDILRLKKTFERYESSLSFKDFSKDFVAVETNAGFMLISPSDISYIAKENRRTLIHCTDKIYSVKYSLDEMEVIFSDYDMFRTHQSFLVPIRKIESVLPTDFGKTYLAKLSDGCSVPVSRYKYAKLREHLSTRGIRFM